MKFKISVLSAFTLLAIYSCHTSYAITENKIYKNTAITEDLVSDKEMNETIAPYKEKLDNIMNQKIAHTNFNLDRTGDNSPIGNLLADYTWEGANDWAKEQGFSVDGAVINIGGIRTSIGKGDILLKHLFEVMPFENELVIVKFKGTDMQGIFDYYQLKQRNNPVANLTISIENNQITKALVGNQPIDANKTYYIATSDYLVGGGDDMNFFKKGEVIVTGVKLRDLYIQKFKHKGEIVPPDDIRLTFKNDN